MRRRPVRFEPRNLGRRNPGVPAGRAESRAAATGRNGRGADSGGVGCCGGSVATARALHCRRASRRANGHGLVGGRVRRGATPGVQHRRAYATSLDWCAGGRRPDASRSRPFLGSRNPTLGQTLRPDRLAHDARGRSDPGYARRRVERLPTRRRPDYLRRGARECESTDHEGGRTLRRDRDAVVGRSPRTLNATIDGLRSRKSSQPAAMVTA